MKVVNTRIGDLPVEAAGDPRLPRLAEWGARLHRLDIAPGAAGNLSVRTDDGFVISRTEVELAAIKPEDWVLVTRINRHEDGTLEVEYHGSHPPSRDGFVHGTVYAGTAEAGAVFHLHDAAVLAHAAALGIPVTEHHFEAGTAESVHEIERLLARLPGIDYFGLVEHGTVAWAADLDTAGHLVETWHERARDFGD